MKNSSIFSRYIVQLTITICIICKLKSQGSLGRGTQRRFPSKYVENTFQAIQSSFRSQERHFKRRYKIGSCSVTLGDFVSCRNYKGFRIIFPEIFRCNLSFYECENFSDSSLNHIFWIYEKQHFPWGVKCDKLSFGKS